MSARQDTTLALWAKRHPVSQMTAEEQQANFDKCSSYRSCSATVCPLYELIESSYFIKGDRRCPKILDYLEGKELPEPLRIEIERTEKRWTKALGKATLERWIVSREKTRKYFEEMD